MQVRHRQLHAFRQAMEADVVRTLGPNHIWVMHFAGDLEGADAIFQEKIVAEGQAAQGCAIRLSAMHSQNAVDHALKAWKCEVAASSTFIGSPPYPSESIPVTFLVRSPM